MAPICFKVQVHTGPSSNAVHTLEPLTPSLGPCLPSLCSLNSGHTTLPTGLHCVRQAHPWALVCSVPFIWKGASPLILRVCGLISFRPLFNNSLSQMSELPWPHYLKFWHFFPPPAPNSLPSPSPTFIFPPEHLPPTTTKYFIYLFIWLLVFPRRL